MNFKRYINVVGIQFPVLKMTATQLPRWHIYSDQSCTQHNTRADYVLTSKLTI